MEISEMKTYQNPVDRFSNKSMTWIYPISREKIELKWIFLRDPWDSNQKSKQTGEKEVTRTLPQAPQILLKI